MRPPDLALVNRFRADFKRLIGRGLDADERIGVAVSGGPDSMALLLLARAAFGARVLAATVDHGLRPEASEEARFVENVAKSLGVEHGTIRLEDEAIATGGNLQAKARRSRYSALGEWLSARDCRLATTAHHIEDQAETLLMRLARGSGVQGMGGVRPVTTFPLRPSLGDLLIVRPVLGWRRRELHEIVAAAGIEPVIDPSNHDHVFDRVKFRALLDREKLLKPARLAAVASNLLEAGDALYWAARQVEEERLVWKDEFTLVLQTDGLPRAIRRLLVRFALDSMHARLRGSGRSIDKLDAFIANVESHGIATLAGVKCSANGASWAFKRAPPRRSG